MMNIEKRRPNLKLIIIPGRKIKLQELRRESGRQTEKGEGAHVIVRTRSRSYLNHHSNLIGYTEFQRLFTPPRMQLIYKINMHDVVQNAHCHVCHIHSVLL